MPNRTFIPLVAHYLLTRRVFRMAFGQERTNQVFRRAGLASTEDYLRLLGLPRWVRSWVDLETRLGHEPGVTKALARIRGEVFIDIGAHIGYYSALLSPNFKTVLAVEPHPSNIESLRRIVAVRRITNVRIIPIAISDREGTDILLAGVFTGAHSFFRSHLTKSDSVTVRVATLDFLIGNPVDLVKMDVEGAEWKVLKGAEKSIRGGKVRRMLIEVHDVERRKEMEHYLRAREYETNWVDPAHIFAQRQSLHLDEASMVMVG